MTEADLQKEQQNGTIKITETQSQESPPDAPPSELEGYRAMLEALRRPRIYLEDHPTFVPRSYADQIQFVDDGVDKFVDVYINGAWEQIKIGSGSSGFAGVRLFNGSDINIADSVVTVLTWNSEDYDTDTFHSSSVNTNRVTVPAGLDGKYFIHLSAFLDGVTKGAGNRKVSINKNGGAGLAEMACAAASIPVGIQITTIRDLAAGDYIDATIFQDSGGTLATMSANYETFLEVYKIG